MLALNGLALLVDINLRLPSRRHLRAFACCESYASRVPNTEHGVTFAEHGSTTRTRAQRGCERSCRCRLALSRKMRRNVGSKTCKGLTYLKLILLNVQGLGRVSKVHGAQSCKGTHQVGDHDLRLTTGRSGGRGRGSLWLLALLVGLLHAAHGSCGGSRAACIRATASSTAAAGLAARLEDVIEAEFHLGRHVGK